MSSQGAQSREKTIRVRTWQEFKSLVIEKKARSIVYVIARSIPARDLTSLKLILPAEEAQYIFVDSAKGDKLRQTRIPIHYDKGTRFIKDEDVKNFLRTQLDGQNLKIFSYWTA